MARRLIAIALAALALAGVGVFLVSRGESTGKPPAAGFAAQKVTVGGLDVVITPARLDAGGAEFKVVFDTHTGAPGIDVAANAALVVDGTPWTGAAWSGDGPGGHHREGTLRFTAAAPAAGDARLTITGLDRPLDTTWKLP